MFSLGESSTFTTVTTLPQLDFYTDGLIEPSEQLAPTSICIDDFSLL